MEFWGIDRSKYSLRLHALEHLLNIATPQDVARVASVIPLSPWQALTTSEVEAALAFSTHVKKVKCTELAGFQDTLRAMLLESPTLRVSTVPGLDPETALSTIRKCPAMHIASATALYAASVGDCDVLDQFLAGVDALAARLPALPETEFASFYGALVGFIDGLSLAKNAKQTSQRYYERIIGFCAPERYRAVQANFDSVRYFSYGLHRCGLLERVAKFSSVCAEAAVESSEFERLTQFSVEQVHKLLAILGSHEYTDDEELDLVKNSLRFHLETLDQCRYHQFVRSDDLYAMVAQALLDRDEQPEGYAVEIAKLSSSLTNQHEKRLIEVLELFPEFVSGLTPHVAFKSATAFADDYKLVHASDASRIRVLYAITNKITEEEIHASIEQRGEQLTMKYVAALFSGLVAFVKSFRTPELADLTVTVLEQKFGSIHEGIDCQVVDSWALLAPFVTDNKFGEVLELLVNAERSQNLKIVKAVRDARITIAHDRASSPEYLSHLLNLVVRRNDSSGDTSWAGNLLAPLAVLAVESKVKTFSWSMVDSFRNAWFNFAMQGATPFSLKDADLQNFKLVAKWTPPLVSEQSANHIESGLQLNSVLCRGVSENILQIQTNVMSKVLGTRYIQSNDVVKTLFLATAFLLETLRQQVGSISKLPRYFEDSEFSAGEGFQQMTLLTKYLTAQYVDSLGYNPGTDLLSVSYELRELLALACHRIDAVRQTAIYIVAQIVQACPAALAQHDALFTLLECLTLLDKAVVNGEEDMYSPRTSFKGALTGVVIEFADNCEARKRCLKDFESNSKIWVRILGQKLREDLRSKIYTYLSHTDSAVGLGRRFALSLLTVEAKNDDYIMEFVMLSRYDLNSLNHPIDHVVNAFRDAKNASALEFAFSAAVHHMRQPDFNAMLLAEESVKAPFRIFDNASLSAGLTFWNYTIRHQQPLRSTIVFEVLEQAIISVYHRKGLFGQNLDHVLPQFGHMDYSPTDKEAINRYEKAVRRQFMPHFTLLSGFLRSCMHNSVLLDSRYLSKFLRFYLVWLRGLRRLGSKHVISRFYRLKIYNCAIELLQQISFVKSSYAFAAKAYARLERAILETALEWYANPIPTWPYGSNQNNQNDTIKELLAFTEWVALKKGKDWLLLRHFLGQEYNRLYIWADPLSRSSRNAVNFDFNVELLLTAWERNPRLAVSICNSWLVDNVRTKQVLIELVRNNPLAVYDAPEALQFYLDSTLGCTLNVNANFVDDTGVDQSLISRQQVSRFVLFWAQVSPIEAINLLAPQTPNRNFVTQYALRALQCHPISICFFYVPQLVQELRNDKSGWIEEYILEAGKVSQKFAHQIIWNIMANMYMDDEGTQPDPLKPQLDAVISKMESSFNSHEKDYFEKEFKFFAAVTGISGTLKPYIKKSKPEKKKIIDQEMAKIEVPEGVYLPSHPDGVVIDIDRKSGKPLQSHAKAPFLARFEIRIDEEVPDTSANANSTDMVVRTNDVWQGAIFKVGDDCRQDVLALQVVSVFRSVFMYSGLDVYCFPYKVTATAAGRGVIDVLPNSVSRDMLGREAVNGLVEWFQSKFGGANSLHFQTARLNFVKSMAAYSVMTYLIQFKDRHNGNIMYDDQGHVIHIDFGFCFDIAPGGVRFEAAPFKLTKEMVQLMGGSSNAPAFKWFEELCVRAYLASRVFANEICGVVIPMLQSGLPCFKGNTIKRLRERFALQKTEAEAAAFMRSLISKSYESNFTKGYDEFQRLTNGIPY